MRLNLGCKSSLIQVKVMRNQKMKTKLIFIGLTLLCRTTSTFDKNVLKISNERPRVRREKIEKEKIL
jgi:hypothetical protein